MHAFLIIGTNNLDDAIDNLVKKLNTKILEYPLAKIEDVRNLNNLIRLSFNEPTLIVSENIHEATEEALNAFLKNLEEPQDNIYFALTAPSTRKVLPTIVSRCQVIKIKNEELRIKNYEETENFLKLSTGEKLNYVDKIKDRTLALKLAEDTVNLLHSRLHENNVKYDVVSKDIEIAEKTYSRLKANGNVNLHLFNFAINLSHIT